jgi:hypothetical protein
MQPIRSWFTLAAALAASFINLPAGAQNTSQPADDEEPIQVGENTARQIIISVH